MKKSFRLYSFLAILLVWTPILKAQTRDGEFQVATGAGIAMNPPVRFDLDLNGEYFWNDTFSFGLDFDILIRGGTYFNFIPFTRYHFDLAKWPRFSPYVGGGIGGLVRTGRGNNRSWFDLMLPEAGFLYELSPHFYVGPNTSFHILAGSDTTWDWQLLGQVAYQF